MLRKSFCVNADYIFTSSDKENRDIKLAHSWCLLIFQGNQAYTYCLPAKRQIPRESYLSVVKLIS